VSLTTGIPAELLYSLSSAITKNNYTTQAAFSGVLGTNTVCKLPGGWLNNDNPNPVGRALMLDVWGTIANTAAATFAVALGFDPTGGTIANSVTVYAATAPTASITTLWNCRVEYTCTAFTTSQASFQINGFWTQSATATGAALGTAGLRTDFQGSISGATVDPRVDNYIELFGTWNAASASNTTTVQQTFLWGQN
jgi:hypothetical protein